MHRAISILVKSLSISNNFKKQIHASFKPSQRNLSLYFIGDEFIKNQRFNDSAILRSESSKFTN